MRRTNWFDQYVSESLFASLIAGFSEAEQVTAAEIVSQILLIAAQTILLEETSEQYRPQVLELFTSNDTEAISDWLSAQPIAIIDALRERLDRTVLQVQAQLAAKTSSAILHQV